MIWYPDPCGSAHGSIHTETRFWTCSKLSQLTNAPTRKSPIPTSR